MTFSSCDSVSSWRERIFLAAKHSQFSRESLDNFTPKIFLFSAKPAAKAETHGYTITLRLLNQDPRVLMNNDPSTKLQALEDGWGSSCE